MDVEEIGAQRHATAGGRAVNIDAVTSITPPAAIDRPAGAGQLEMILVVEGTATFRYSFSSTAPTAGAGLLGSAPTAVVPITMRIRGERLISNFRIIGTAAGDTISYDFIWGARS